MARRRSINIKGFSHGTNPTPAASRVGNILFTGGISGQDTTTGLMPDDVSEQTRLAFINMRAILAAGGADLEDIVKIEFYAKDVPAAREAINREWIVAFPDPESRPARHIFAYELPGSMLMQCDVFAVASRD
ncbi:MAG: RidA family protein [Phenylobacterium sp.]|uniref:RidA family protein n=1 Tax=Phenylobacterium sp. TaxID=1871053 RepID=UPI002734D398|nr:RidA family protein [Phenylobacterium sp.]MDP3173423.1 RidA family protein [Phenylobacterium sp.]